MHPTRRHHLRTQLDTIAADLGDRTTGAAVVLFLDRLARLEAGNAPDLATWQAARLEHAADLARIAGAAIDTEALLHTGRHIEDDDRDGWLRDLLTVATVAPWLEPEKRAAVAHAVDVAAAMIEADPETWLEASVLTWDRHRFENPAGLSEEARVLLRTLADLPIVVAWDRAAR